MLLSTVLEVGSEERVGGVAGTLTVPVTTMSFPVPSPGPPEPPADSA